MSRYDEPINLKTPAEIQKMTEAGAVLREVMDLLAERVKPGVSTLELDRFARSEIEKRKATPAFLGLYGFPGTLCVSVNEEVVHGIPGQRTLNDGDIISVDVGLIRGEFYSDMARTIPVGQIGEESRRLIEVTTQALDLAIRYLVPGKRLGDLSAAVQSFVEGHGYSVVRDYTGHGIGRKLHEEPKIPNYGTAGRGVRWKAGMVVCIEPMVNAGAAGTRTLSDRWTVVTADGKRSAHMEHTVAITEEGPMILTA